MVEEGSVIDWIAEADPALRWQVERDLQDAPESTWAPIRALVETEGAGARLLALQDPDGQWAGGAFVPHGFTGQRFRDEGQPWTATTWALTQLREFGLDPNSARTRETVRLIGENSRWDHAGQPYWTGEVEECINGRAVADGAYFGVDVAAIVARLVREVQADGGWNCERGNGSSVSSFATTINVLEGLLEFERATGGTTESRHARRRGEEYLLTRRLFRRASTGEPADEQFLTLTYPTRWHYDVLRSLDYFRSAGRLDRAAPDARLEDGIELIRSKRDQDGRWAMDWKPRGATPFDLDDGPGQPSRWITLRAMRVLRWWDGPHP
ncbi:MAG: squalene cyclase [Actinomycetota bacterium]